MPNKRLENDIIRKMLSSHAILAPMAGVTDAAFRIMCRKYGCKFAFTEMIDVNGIVYNNRKTFELMEHEQDDIPLGVQIAGYDRKKILYAAKVCEDKGFKVLDLNAGCPARKVVKAGKGAALLQVPDKLGRIVEDLVKALSIPVTVKIRSGWDEEHKNYIEVAKKVGDSGASALCIHPRTKEQMFSGHPEYEIVGKIKKAIEIPVFASGNIFSADAVKELVRTTGCDGVFVARGALGRPWIFQEIDAVTVGGQAKSNNKSFEDIKNIMKEHFDLSIGERGLAAAKKRMYKHICWYLKGKKNLNDIMKCYQRLDTQEDIYKFFDLLSLRDEKRLHISCDF